MRGDELRVRRPAWDLVRNNHEELVRYTKFSNPFCLCMKGFLSFCIRKNAKEEKKMAEQNNKSKKGLIIGIVALVAVIAVLAVVFFVFREKPTKGAKAITIEVVDDQGTKTTYNLNTDAEYLKQAMEEADGLTFSGSESDYGLYLETVNGLTADYNTDGAYWSIYVNGGYGQYGVDSQPVADGDTYTLQYEKYTE